MLVLLAYDVLSVLWRNASARDAVGSGIDIGPRCAFCSPDPSNVYPFFSLLRGFCCEVRAGVCRQCVE